MAVARLVCSDCLTPLAPSDAYCRSCGAKIEREGPPPEEVRLCTVCGFSNKGEEEYCQSCGARLPGRMAMSQPGAQKAKKPQRAGEGRKRFEPWQIVSVVAVLALLSYLVATQITTEKPQQSFSSPSGTAQHAPVLGSASAPPDIAPLEQEVHARPNDAGALLKLANALHDNRLLPRAVETYRKYLTMRSEDPDARTDLGICYFEMAQADSVHRTQLLEEAAGEMQTAFKNSPGHQASAFNLGVVNLHMGNLEESNKWFRKAVEINKDSDMGVRAQNILKQHSFQQ